LGVGEDVAKDTFGQFHGERIAGEAGERADPDEGAFEFTDVVGDIRGNEFKDICGRSYGFALGLLAKNRETGLEFRGVDLGDETHFEAASQAVFEGRNGIRRAIGRKHNLGIGLIEGFKGVEELFLEAFFALDDLDVIEKKHVDFSVALFELRHRVLADRIHVLIQELFGGDVANLMAGVDLADVIGNGLQKVGFAEPRVAIDKEWVVGLGSSCSGAAVVPRSDGVVNRFCVSLGTSPEKPVDGAGEKFEEAGATSV
jgi:hypothetical protein